MYFALIEKCAKTTKNQHATKWQLNLTQGSALGKNITEQAP